MKHYICEGDCKGVAVEPGLCQSTDCQNYNQSLAECDCEDKSHESPHKSAPAATKEEND